MFQKGGAVDAFALGEDGHDSLGRGDIFQWIAIHEKEVGIGARPDPAHVFKAEPLCRACGDLVKDFRGRDSRGRHQLKLPVKGGSVRQIPQSGG